MTQTSHCDAMDPMGEETKRVTLRLPLALAVNVEKRAEEKNMSTHQWIVRALAASYARATKDGVTIIETRGVEL